MSAGICALLVPALLLVFAGGARPSETLARVKFGLKVPGGNTNAVDISLRFNLESGKKALVKPSAKPVQTGGDSLAPACELLSRPVPEYQVEPLEAPATGWSVTGVKGGEVSIDYRVTLPHPTGHTSASEGGDGYVSDVWVVEPGLGLLAGSTAFMCPRDAESGSYLADDYALEIEMAGGEKALVPFAADGESFTVARTRELLENYVCWGKLAVSGAGVRGTEVSVGFAGGFMKLSGDERKKYAEGLSSLFDGAAGVLGARPGLERLAALVDDAGRLGLDGSASSTLLGSVLLFQQGERTLEGDRSVVASRGLFDLWNRWSMVPASEGEAFWFQAGLPGVYGDRLAVRAGFEEAGRAYGSFARLYAAYLADPRSKSLSLTEAWERGDMEFVTRKSTVLCAAIDKRLRDLTDGSKDIDWLTGQVAAAFDHFEGHDYTLVDIEELLENATGKSWARFFDEGVRGTGIIYASEFSSTQLFGPASAAGKPLSVSGSGKGWILLAVAIVVILMIPLVFSTYVNRSVKLDLTMPKILPDDDD